MMRLLPLFWVCCKMGSRKGKRWRGTVLTGLGALLLLMCTGVCAEIQEVRQAVGRSITLNVTYSGVPSDIIWKKNKNKVVVLEPHKSPQFYILEDRATMSQDNGSLTINNLLKEDSGDYKAEAWVDSTSQDTFIKLIVLDCPDKPKITDNSTKERTILHCDSSNPEVSYLWKNQTGGETPGQSYQGPRPKEDAVTLTCVVDNRVCDNETSITVNPISDTGDSKGVNVRSVVVVVGVIFVVLLIVIIWIYYRCPLLCCPEAQKRRKDNPSGPEATPFMPRGVPGVTPGSLEHTYIDVESCGHLMLNLSNHGPVHRLKFEKSGLPSIDAEVANLKGHQERVTLSLTIHDVKPEDYPKCTAVSGLTNGKTRVFTIEGNDVRTAEQSAGSAGLQNRSEPEPPDIKISKLNDNKVKLEVPITEETTITWKKGDEAPFEWTVCGLTLTAKNITVTSESLTINNLTSKDSGLYKVDLQSAENSTSQSFKVEVIKLSKAKTSRKVVFMVKSESLNPSKEDINMSSAGHWASDPIGNITFHPIEVADLAPIIWMKEDKQLVADEKISLDQNGDLTLRNVTSADQGKYTVCCKDQTLEQFELKL